MPELVGSIKWSPLQYEGDAGANAYVGTDAEGNVVTIDQQTPRSNERVLREAREVRNHGNALARRGPLRPMADIPEVLFWKWRKEWQQSAYKDWSFKMYIRLKVNNPDYAYLRTVDHRLHVDSSRPTSAAASVA